MHVIGASGRSGVALCRALAADGVAVVPVVRDSTKWRAGGIGVAPLVADLTDAKSVIQEMQAIVPDFPSVPVRFIIIKSQKESLSRES